ncbi:unnamed protein product, partial [Urochloa humidicola]
GPLSTTAASSLWIHHGRQDPHRPQAAPLTPNPARLLYLASASPPRLGEWQPAMTSAAGTPTAVERSGIHGHDLPTKELDSAVVDVDLPTALFDSVFCCGEQITGVTLPLS